MKVLSTTSNKGGVGKTTLAVFLALAWAKMGQRGLLVDLDHNNNLTDYFLRDADIEEIEARNVYHVFTGKLSLAGATWKAMDGLDIIPATPNLSKIGIELAQDPGAVLRFKNKVEQADYDFIILDTHNGINFGLTAALYTAKLILTPASVQRWNAKGYAVIAEEVAKVADYFGESPALLAVPSMVSPTQAAAIRAAKAWTSTQQAIYNDQSLRNAVNCGRGLREHTLADDAFLSLARELDTFCEGRGIA